MLTTTVDMYKAFLDGIKKSETSIVEPEQFNRIINHWGQDEYLRSKMLAIEVDQKKIEDLEKIRVATDGKYKYQGAIVYPIAPNTNETDTFTIPKYTQTINARVGTEIQAKSYPKYLRLLSAMFAIEYGEGQACGKTGVSGYLHADIMRSDQRSKILNNPFRKPSDKKLYYETIDGNIRLITGTTSKGYSLRLEYLRYPIEIYFNATSPADTGDPLTGSVVCEFDVQQRQEIVEIAVRTYLERVKDPRYQSFLNEEIIKAQGK